MIFNRNAEAYELALSLESTTYNIQIAPRAMQAMLLERL